MKPESIAVVGGMGRMGSLMGRFFEHAGLVVHSVDSRHGPVDWNEVARHDVILLAVPLSVLDDVIGELGPVTRTDGAVIDIASVKEQPVAAMLGECRGEVIGSHPLFGPTTSTLKDQTFFVYPARSSKWIGWFRQFLREHGARIVDMDPQEHDRLMATVQVLRHILLLSFGHALMRTGFDLTAQLRDAGPWFSQLVALLNQQIEQPSDLYADLAFSNPAVDEVITQLRESVMELHSICIAKDRNQMDTLISQVTAYVGQACSEEADSDALTSR